MKGLLGFLLGLGLVVLVLAFVFGDVIPPGFVGVRQIKFGPGQGFSLKGLKPGYHWVIPFYSEIHLVPKKLQLLHLDRELGLHQNALGSLEVQTTDGTAVDVDMSILVRFFEEPGEAKLPGEVQETIKHGGPADLIKNVGLTNQRWNNHLKRVAEDNLRRTLGGLSNPEFYNPHLREKAIEQAIVDMNRRLFTFGVSVEALMLRRYTYKARSFDEAIFQKNLQAQEKRLNAQASKLAEAKAKVEGVSAKWDAEIKTLRVKADNDSKVIMSEADLYETEMRSKGDLGVAKATAEVDRLRAQALAQSAGARIFVAREMAPLLSSLKGGVVSNVDPYNLESWLRKLGVTEN